MLFAVADTGIGIPQEDLVHLFEDFHQLDGSLTRKHGGTGLGLAISRRLTELMGGRIWVESDPGQGSTFYFTLIGEPAAAPPRRPPAPLTPIPESARPIPSSPLRILLAEDHPVNRQVILGLLEHLGYRADVAANGREVLETLARQPYDVVLMDVQMPEMDGLEATRRIRGQTSGGPRPRIVAMTAHAMSGDRERCLEAGMDGYVSKPVRLDDLAAALAGAEPGHAPGEEAGLGPLPPAPLDLAALDHLRKLSTGSEDLLGTLIQTYSTSSADDLSALRQLAAAGSWSDVARVAHRLKGGSLSLGAVRVAAVCVAIEERVRSTRTAEVGPLVAHLEQELVSAQSALDKVMREKATSR